LGRGLLTVGRSSPSPFDKSNCALDYDSPLGFAVILSSRWGKAGLWVDFRGSSFDGPSGSRGHFGWTTNQSGGAENRHNFWWSSRGFRPLPRPHRVAGSPIVGWIVELRRRGSPRRSIVYYCTATTMASPPDLPKLDATARDMRAGTSAVTPAGAAPGESARGSGIPFTPPPLMADLVHEKARRVPPGADSFLPRRHSDRTGFADQEHDPVTPVAMTDRESLLADVSQVIAVSPPGSAQDAPRRDFPVDTRKSRSKGKTRRQCSPLPSPSSTSSSSPLTTTDDDKDRVGTKTGSGKLAVLECPDYRFAGVLDY